MRNYALDYVVIGATWLLIGMLLGIVMGAKEDYQLVAVHAHINLIGFACHSIFGMVYKQWPMLNSSQNCPVPVLDIRHFNTDYFDWPCFYGHRRAGPSHNPWLRRGIRRRRAILLDGLARAVRRQVNER